MLRFVPVGRHFRATGRVDAQNEGQENKDLARGETAGVASDFGGERADQQDARVVRPPRTLRYA